MKKLLFLLSVSILFFSSCIPNPEENPDPIVPVATLFLKKTIDTYDGGETVTTNYTYSGNKLVSIVSDTPDEPNLYVTYTGNLITKGEYKFADGTIDQINTFEYDDTNRLVTYKRVDPEMDLGNKETYVYNLDGTISVTYFIGDATTQTEAAGTGTVTFEDGEISEISSPEDTFTYVYDNKSNPLKNVLGWNKIAFVDGEGNGVAHNITSFVHTNAGMPMTFTYEYTYASGYPIESVANDEDGTYTTEYFY
jgi:hypothetical protein